MTTTSSNDACCVALELSKSIWVCAFAAPGDTGAAIHKIGAGDVERLLQVIGTGKSKAEARLQRCLETVLCYEIGYDGFWLARALIGRGIRTVVFDPASFLMPRRGRRAKTDRLDAEGMTRTLRTWLAGDRDVAHEVKIPTVEQEDAKRIERERKSLVEERIGIVGRIKGLLALHGIWLTSKRVSKYLLEKLDGLRTGDGRPLAPFLRCEIERLLQRYNFVSQQIADVEADRRKALGAQDGRFPHAAKVNRLMKLGGVGETTATVLVAEVYHRNFPTRRHVASFVGLAPNPYNSGDSERDRGIGKAGSKFARQTFVELAWFWLRYQPGSKLSRWWHERFGGKGMRNRKVGIVALARKLAVALWQFVESGIIPEGATLKA